MSDFGADGRVEAARERTSGGAGSEMKMKSKGNSEKEEIDT